MPAMDHALDAWRKVLGDAYVVTAPAERAEAATATFATTQSVPAILRPGDREAVQRCVAIAARFGVALYTVSRGRNWGLGSRVPVRDGCVLLDLSRMDRIVAFDEEMAWVTVEPGVTFGQLYDYLRGRRSRLFASTTGASPGASVVGNALERGDGSGPYGDRFQHVCALEVVLATGECVHTGFGRLGDSPVAPLHRWGVGPSLDGIFSQSNLGVVTRMTVWLSPLPRSLQCVRFALRDPARLPALVDALRTLRMDGTVRCAVGLWNDYRVLSTRQRYPWALTAGRTPLRRDDLDALRDTHGDALGDARWFGTTALYAATEAQGRAHREHLVSVLAPRVDTWSIEERNGEPWSGHELLVADDPAFFFLQGIPHEESLRSAYWRKREVPATGLDPDRDRCGVVWVCPVVPFRGADALRAAQIAEDLCLAHGFEPLTTLVAQTERTMYLAPAVVYDRDVPGEDARAMACHDALLERFIAEGFPPYRLGIQSMDKAPVGVDGTDALLTRIKAALDPAGILAPGRYEPPKGC